MSDSSQPNKPKAGIFANIGKIRAAQKKKKEINVIPTFIEWAKTHIQNAIFAASNVGCMGTCHYLSDMVYEFSRQNEERNVDVCFNVTTLTNESKNDVMKSLRDFIVENDTENSLEVEYMPAEYKLSIKFAD